jgi:hypothetical protein
MADTNYRIPVFIQGDTVIFYHLDPDIHTDDYQGRAEAYGTAVQWKKFVPMTHTSDLSYANHSYIRRWVSISNITPEDMDFFRTNNIFGDNPTLDHVQTELQRACPGNPDAEQMRQEFYTEYDKLPLHFKVIATVGSTQALIAKKGARMKELLANSKHGTQAAKGRKSVFLAEMNYRAYMMEGRENMRRNDIIV